MDPAQEKIKFILELFSSNKLIETRKEIDRQLIVYSKSSILFNILGAVLVEQNKPQEAIENYNKSIKINPNYAQAYNNLGVCLHSLGKIEEAIQSYQKAIKIRPRHTETYNNLGAIFKEKGEREKSITYFQKAIEFQPKHADAYNNLGTIFKEKGEREKSITYFQKAIEFQPKHADAYNNLGAAFKELKDYKKSIYYYKKAIQIKPSSTMYSNLGNAFKGLGEYNKAINYQEKAIQINPKYADAYYNLATIFEEISEFKKAIKYYLKVIDIQPDHPYAYNNLLFNTCWSYENENYLKLTKKNYESIPKQNKKKLIGLKNSSEKILNVGFVSGDLNKNAVGYFLLDTLKYLRDKNLKLFAYSNNIIEDDFSKLIKKNFDNWILVSHKTDIELINLIRKDNIDILFDLSGHSRNNRLPVFKNRCAPVQAAWIGWSATTGISEIDYIIGDIYATPLSDQNKFSEKIYQLKNIWQSLSISNSDFKVPFVKNNNKENVVLGCLANSMKLNDYLIKIWSRILNQIPNSKLILRNKNFAISKVRKKFIEKFENNKINKNQLIIEGQSFKSKSEYLEYYNKIDIVLDTFPVSGVTTSFDASYMGVPILTKIHNKSFWFRSGESINKNLNMDDWIAKDENDYIQKAIKFSANKNYLINLKIELRNLALKSSLFDSKNYSNHFYEMLLNIKK